MSTNSIHNNIIISAVDHPQKEKFRVIMKGYVNDSTLHVIEYLGPDSPDWEPVIAIFDFVGGLQQQLTLQPLDNCIMTSLNFKTLAKLNLTETRARTYVIAALWDAHTAVMCDGLTSLFVRRHPVTGLNIERINYFTTTGSPLFRLDKNYNPAQIAKNALAEFNITPEMHANLFSNPQPENGLIILAQKVSSNFIESKKLLLQALKMNPNNDEAYFSLGNLLTGVGNFYSAQQCFERALFINMSTRYCIALAKVHQQIGNTIEAIKFAHHALAMDPKNHIPIGIIGAISLNERKFDQAEEYINKALANWKTGDNTEYLGLYLESAGLLYVKLGKSHEAIRFLEKACEFSENVFFAFVILEKIYRKNNELLLADNFLNKAINFIKFNPSKFQRLGEIRNSIMPIYTQMGLYEIVKQDLIQVHALCQEPQNAEENKKIKIEVANEADAKIERSVRRISSKHHNDLLHDLENTFALETLGLIYKLENNTDKSRHYLSLAASKKYNSFFLQQHIGDYYRYIYYSTTDEKAKNDLLSKVYDHYHKAVQLNPNSSFAHQGMGETLRLKKQFKKATQHLKYALKLSPKSSFALANLGIIYSQQGNFKHRKYFNLINKFQPQTFMVEEHLQKALFARLPVVQAGDEEASTKLLNYAYQTLDTLKQFSALPIAAERLGTFILQNCQNNKHAWQGIWMPFFEHYFFHLLFESAEDFVNQISDISKHLSISTKLLRKVKDYDPILLKAIDLHSIYFGISKNKAAKFMLNNLFNVFIKLNNGYSNPFMKQQKKQCWAILKAHYLEKEQTEKDKESFSIAELV